MKNKVSIVITCYNQASFLGETIDSVTKQTYTNWECILINDGSTDSSEIIAIQKTKGDDRFQYIYQKNMGVCVARNNAINLAKGEYLLCLDGDDLISENFLEQTLKNFDDNTDIVATKVIFFGRSKGVYIPNKFTLNDLLHENKLVITCLIKKSNFIDVGGFNPNMKEGFEDWDFWIRYFNKYPNIKVINSTSFHYRLQIKSRNRNIDDSKETKLRYQIWINNYDLFSKEFFDPKKTFEYKNISNSLEYKLGKLILKPVRFLLKK